MDAPQDNNHRNSRRSYPDMTPRAAAGSDGDAAEAPEKIDYNALDNTFGGQLIQAGFVFGWYALADVTEHVAAARTALVAANLATIAAFNAFDEDPANDLTTAVHGEAGPAKTWAVIGGLGAAAVGVTAVSAKLNRAAAVALRRRGVDTPWTLMGAVVAGGYLVAKAVTPSNAARAAR